MCCISSVHYNGECVLEVICGLHISLYNVWLHTMHYQMKFYSFLSEYVCRVPVDYERADGEKCLELLSHDAYTVIKDAVFAELSATPTLFFYNILLFLSLSLTLIVKKRFGAII